MTATSRPGISRRGRAACTRRVSGSSRCEPATWQSPSRSAVSPPSEPTLEDASVTSGSRARSFEAARSSTRSCEPVTTMVRSISPTPRSSRTAHLLARVVALQLGGNDEQPVGADERGEHAGAAGERRGDEPAADPAEPDPHPVVHAHRRSELAREPGGATGASGGGAPSSRASSGAAKMSKVSAAETGIAGSTEDRGGRRPVRGPPEHHRVPWAHRDAVHRERSHLGDDRRRVVVAARAEPAITTTRSDLAAAARTAAAISSGCPATTSNRCASHPAASAWAATITEFVSGSSPVAELGPDRADLVTGRDHRHDRPATDEPVGRPGSAGGGDVNRPQPVAGWQQQLRGAHVLADRADVLVRRGGRAQLDAAVARGRPRA